MTTTTLDALLAQDRVLLADGAMGTNLFALGLETGESPELWNVDQPDRVAAVHRSFVGAGSDIILTNTFGANRYRLSLHGAEDRVDAFNRAGAALARRVADGADRPVLVAGSMGPTGEIYRPVGTLSRADGATAYAEQAQALADGGADVLWIETISGSEELQAAIEGALVAGLPVIATMTFDTKGRTMMGLTPTDALAAGTGFGQALAAFGANCGIGPAELVISVLDLTAGSGASVPIVAKGNCGVPEYKDGAIHYCGTPEIMADYASLVRDAGARIIGGCCGTTAQHVRVMADALAIRPPGGRPERTDVEGRLGPVSPSPQAAAERPRRRRRRQAG